MKERMPLKCRKCGERIAIISWGVYRKAVVNPGAVMVVPKDGGEEFIRIDGSKLLGREARYEEGGEPAYRMHRKTCGRRT